MTQIIHLNENPVSAIGAGAIPLPHRPSMPCRLARTTGFDGRFWTGMAMVAVIAGGITGYVPSANAMSGVVAGGAGMVGGHGGAIMPVAQPVGQFSADETRIILDVLGHIANGSDSGSYDRSKGNKDKGGKDKGGKGLPPGIAMKLQRGGTLPPGLARRDLPPDLISRLPVRNDGTIRQIVGNDVVLIQKGTEIILDILHDVLRH